jgi:protein-S-isoprenylcysteine O-methyltransferase Ste14
MNVKPDRAPIIAPPPLLGLVCIALAFWAKHFKTFPLFETKSSFQVVVGALLIVFSVAIVLSARQVFIAHGTHPNPYRPTNAIVTRGVYRFSRNPIYVAFLLIVLAFALLANSWWFVVVDGMFLLLLHFGVVKHEESYLLEKFGDPYRQYCREVRRWV